MQSPLIYENLVKKYKTSFFTFDKAIDTIPLYSCRTAVYTIKQYRIVRSGNYCLGAFDKRNARVCDVFSGRFNAFFQPLNENGLRFLFETLKFPCSYNLNYGFEHYMAKVRNRNRVIDLGVYKDDIL